MQSVILPQAFRAVIPPLASTYIALAKNTSVALAIGVTEASFVMNKLINDNAADQWWIFFGFAAGYVLIVLAIAAIVHVARADGAGGAMSSVLFDVPGPRARRRHRIYAGHLRRARRRWHLAAVVTEAPRRRRPHSRGLQRRLPEPATSKFLCEGFVKNLRPPALAIVVVASLLGLVLRRRAAVRPPAGPTAGVHRSIELFRAVPLVLLIVFFFFST